MTEKPATFSVKDATRYAMIGAFILAALLGGYAWRGETPPAQPAGSPEPMTIAANTHYAGTGLVFVAQVKGYFANEGLNVTLQPYTTGKDALDAAMEGRAELATVADIPIMFAVMKGQPVSIVATIFTVEKDPGIIGRKDKGVLTLASLNGKRIGLTLGTSGHFVLDAFLIRQKLSTDDVTLRDLQPQELAEALLQGDVDAVATWEPYLGALRTQLGANGMIFYSEGIYELPFTIAGTQDYVVSHPEDHRRCDQREPRGYDGAVAHFRVQRDAGPKPVAHAGGRNALGDQEQTDRPDRHAQLLASYLPRCVTRRDAHSRDSHSLRTTA